MYGLSVCTDDNHSLKLVAYRLVHTDEPYINLHLNPNQNFDFMSDNKKWCLLGDCLFQNDLFSKTVKKNN